MRTFSVPRTPRRRAFTLVELLTVILIITTLMALLLPAVGHVRSRARSANCQNNLSEIGIAVRNYNHKSPNPLRSDDWMNRILPHLDGKRQLFLCPEDSDTALGGTSYGMHHEAHRLHGGDMQKIMMLDYLNPEIVVIASTTSGQDNWDATVAPRHAGRINVLYSGGSILTKDPADLDPRRCAPFEISWRPMRDHTVLTNCVN